MADEDRIGELVKEIAHKHGIAVGRDDPIMILHTINERLMRDSKAAQQEILGQFRSELELIAHQWNAGAKDKAERTLNAALSATKAAMANTMQEGADAAAAAMGREIDVAASMLDAAARRTRNMALINLVAATFTAVAAVLTATIWMP